MVNLHYTGHPFLDVGLAVITVYSKKEKPEDLTQEDLVKMADFIKENYPKNPIKSYLSMILTNNSGYSNPSMGDAKREEYYNTYLYGFLNNEKLDRNCIFFNKPASALADRTHIPLLSAKTDFNFVPSGEIGLPISSEASLCLQALTLGTAKCSYNGDGRALSIHSNKKEFTQFFAKKHFLKHQELMGLSDDKSNPMKYPKTIIMCYLTEAFREFKSEFKKETRDKDTIILNAYLFTNFGTSANIDILSLPLNQINFLRRVTGAKYSQNWNKIVYKGWQYKTEGKGKKTTVNKNQISNTIGESRNVLYEDLFELPENAERFIRTYFLRKSIKNVFSDDQRRDYSLTNDLDLINWDITALFLEEILEMEKERIETIKNFADKLANHITKENDKKFFKTFYYHSNYYNTLRNILLKLNHNCVQKGNEPILTTDEFLTIFEYGEYIPHKDWRLARDLITIRLIEQLHQKEWFNNNKEVIQEELSENTDKEEVVV